MDSHNLFMTRTTYRLVRLEYAAVLGVSIVLAIGHLGDINWIAFAALFAYIDVLGYWPGAVAYQRAKHGPIPKFYYALYNSTHSLLSAAAVAGATALIFHTGWALLALPIHLCGDRAIFGNFLKPCGVSFEPVTHPAYKEFVARYDQPDARIQPAALVTA